MATTLVLLGGNDSRNASWIQDVEKVLAPSFDETHIQNYQHREKGNGSMDLDHEVEVLCDFAKGTTNDLIVFAKSLGCIVALIAMIKKKISVKRCIFAGFPMGFVANNDFPIQEYLKQVSCPILFVQQSEDPAGYYQSIVNLFSPISPKFTFKKLSGSDHAYKDIEAFRGLDLR